MSSFNSGNGIDTSAMDLAALSSQLSASRAAVADRIMAQMQAASLASSALEQPSKKRKKDSETSSSGPRPPTLGLGAALPPAGTSALGAGPNRSDNRLKGALTGGARARGAKRDREAQLAEDRRAADEARKAQEKQEEEERTDGRSANVKKRKDRQDPFAQITAASSVKGAKAERAQATVKEDHSGKSVGSQDGAATRASSATQNTRDIGLNKAADLAGAQAAERAASAGMGRKAQKKARIEARKRVLQEAGVESGETSGSKGTGISGPHAADEGSGKLETMFGTADAASGSLNESTKVDRRDKETNGALSDGAPTSYLTPLQSSAAAQLAGARFRSINEALYTSSGAEAVSLAKEDSTRMQEYHRGFRSQTQSWPLIPVDAVVKILCTAKIATSSCAGKHVRNPVVVDLGAGEAPLAKALAKLSNEAHQTSGPAPVAASKKKLTNFYGHTWSVLSFDLDTSPDGWVVGANVAQHVPLPGAHHLAEDREGVQDHGDIQSKGKKGQKGTRRANPEIVDVVVFCLALMGTDWMGMILEAHRILQEGGDLIIAEVSSRHTSIEDFTDLIREAGFELKKSDSSNTHFSLFEFCKIERPTQNSPKNRKELAEWRDKLCEKGRRVLKPCLYKRR
ncbi:Predicted RNA methylase involved in rRNA processing [Ceraceosorus bombacis]|uniref:Ribosomal RNA-processing protein 8 n=1 Tax=Ceraceosorus bombacis TaxID=401625 RepID=A0A0N7L9I9_9BASI|nr:Predicted RNA methylase involved in rRNA processing [Ceraceosorus bombacis]